MLRMGGSVETENRLMAARVGKGRNGEWLLLGISIFWGGENVLGVDSGDVFTLVDMLNSIELYTVKGWVYVIWILFHSRILKKLMNILSILN